MMAATETKRRLGAGDFGKATNDDANDTTTTPPSQAWQRFLPSDLLAEVQLYRRNRPHDPLPCRMQLEIASRWAQGECA